MEDDKLKDLFESFQPQLSSDSQFLSKLKRNMESVELVKLHTASVRRNNKIAVIVAAMAGFAMGYIVSFFIPLLSAWISSIKISLPDFGLPMLSFDGQIIAWGLTGLVCMLTAINAYEITLSQLSVREKIQNH